jgi:hypothetical protein
MKSVVWESVAIAARPIRRPLNDFQCTFGPVSLLLRGHAEMAADLGGSGERQTLRAAVAVVESHIANGDSLGNQRQYSDALTEYSLHRQPSSNPP